MLTKLMVAIDGSEQSYKGAELALELAQKTGSEVTFLEVVVPIPAYGPEGRALVYDIHERDLQLTKEAEADLAKAAAKFTELGVPFKTKVLIGNPAEAIVLEAEQEGASMIIMGTRGKTGVSRFMMGSVSSKVVAHAHCSVLVTR